MMSVQHRSGTEDMLAQLRRIGRYFRPHWGGWSALLLLGLLMTVLSMVSPLMVKLLIDDVLVAGDIGKLNAIIAIFAVVVASVTLLSAANTWLFTRLQQTMLLEVRSDLFRHIESLDMDFFHEKAVGDLLSRLTIDIQGVSEFVSAIFQTGVMNVLMVLFIFGMAFTIHPVLMLLSAAVLPFLIISQKRFGQKVKAGYESYRAKNADLLDFLQEKMSTISLTKIFNMGSHEREREHAKGKELVRHAMDVTTTSSVATAVSSLLAYTALLGVLWLGGHEVISGAITIGALVAFYSYVSMAFAPIKNLTDMNLALQDSKVKIGRVFDILDRKPQVNETPGARPLNVTEGAIRFDCVGFDYGSGRALMDINLDIAPGETVRIVGTSGAGKTTIAKLLLRLYDPKHGRITIDGQDISTVQLASLRSAIGLVKQEQIILRSTVSENIAYGKAGASSDDVVAAAKAAYAHDFIMKLPHGYETVIGAGAIELSGGQSQRISIARTLLRNPKILILDEPASALDTRTQADVDRSLKNIVKGRTTIIITHRLHSFEKGDRLVVIDDGRIVEDGTFERLLEKKGLFYSMYRLVLENA